MIIHFSMIVDVVVVFVAALGGVQRLTFVCAQNLFLLSCAGRGGPDVGVSFSNFVFAVGSRLSGVDHLSIISLSPELSFSLRLRCDAYFSLCCSS